LKHTPLPPLPGQEPKRDKSDPALFDRFNVTKASKLFGRDLPDHIEERSEPYTLSRKRGLRAFRSQTGEVVQRYRGGKGFTPIYEPWSPDGLLRVRGRLMAVRTTELVSVSADQSCHTTPINAPGKPAHAVGQLLLNGDASNGKRCACGRQISCCLTAQARKQPATALKRSIQWADYPRGWSSAEPNQGPHILLLAASLMLEVGANVSGCNHPLAGEYLAKVKAENLQAQRIAAALGPKIDENTLAPPEPTVPPWSQKLAQPDVPAEHVFAAYLVELRNDGVEIGDLKFISEAYLDQHDRDVHVPIRAALQYCSR